MILKSYLIMTVRSENGGIILTYQKYLLYVRHYEAKLIDCVVSNLWGEIRLVQNTIADERRWGSFPVKDY